MEEEQEEKATTLDDEVDEDEDEQDSGGTHDDAQHNDEEVVVNCQGCRATADDDVPGRLWVQCGGCATWMHGRCVGRYSLRQCEELDFTCFECQTTEARGERGARRTTPSARKPCTA